MAFSGIFMRDRKQIFDELNPIDPMADQVNFSKEPAGVKGWEKDRHATFKLN